MRIISNKNIPLDSVLTRLDNYDDYVIVDIDWVD